MIKKTLKVTLPSGQEARSAAELVQVASRYGCSVYIETGEKRINAKSIMGMMTLNLDSGDAVTVSADGADEEKAMADIERFLQNGAV